MPQWSAHAIIYSSHFRNLTQARHKIENDSLYRERENMNYFKMIVLTLAATILTGCAATGPKYSSLSNTLPTLGADKGRIYFYRESGFIGGGLQPNIRLNEVVVGESKPGGFFFVDQSPGQYSAATKTEVDNSVDFSLDAGERKYIKTSISMGLLVGHVSPKVMDEEQAQKEMQNLSYIGSAVATTTPPSPAVKDGKPMVSGQSNDNSTYLPIAVEETGKNSVRQSPPKRVGRIYIYRNKSIFGGRYTPEVTIDNEKIAVSTSGTYVFVNKKPGQYNVSFDGNEKDPLPVVVTGGESQYVQANVSKGLLEDHLKLQLVTQSEGEGALTTLKYIGTAPLRSLTAQNEAEEVIAQEDIQKVEFHLGRSSYVVGEMAKQNGCFSNTDAALITEQGPIEIYRMNCGNGKAFMARCELRQCVQMKH